MYIGRAIGLKAREQGYARPKVPDSEAGKLRTWLLELKSEGLNPIFELLYWTVSSHGPSSEVRHRQIYRSRGVKLLNIKMNGGWLVVHKPDSTDPKDFISLCQLAFERGIAIKVIEIEIKDRLITTYAIPGGSDIWILRSALEKKRRRKKIY